jgi:four helix bundle protein
MNVAEEIYNLTGKFPKDEAYGLTSQLRRAAVSIPSNIAEGQSRNSAAEFIHRVPERKQRHS